MGRLRNWKLPHGDAAFEIDDAKVFIISDPYHPLDQKHIDRLQGENVTKLKAWYSGHFSPVFLRRAELLKPVFSQAIEGTLSEASFYELYRGRCKLPWYRKSLEESLHAKGHHKLADRVGPAFVTANIQHRSENVWERLHVTLLIINQYLDRRHLHRADGIKTASPVLFFSGGSGAFR